MSKAFTKDEGTSESVQRPPRAAAGGKRPITAEGREALVQLLDGLIAERRTVAAGVGIDVAARCAELDGKITLTRSILEGTEVVAPVPGEGAYFGAWVELEDDSGARQLYRLVGPDEVDPKRGLISIESPLGRALLGHKVGDAVVFDRPRGRAELEIVDLSYEPRADPSQ